MGTDLANRNVFVLGTGRTASVTFWRACGHITNYTAGHEERSRVLGRERLAYPLGHIEVDNRLSWFLGRLDRRYGDEAYYVHLRRDPESVARSFQNRFGWGIIAAYWQGVLEYGSPYDQPLEICRDYVDTVESNIALFLKDKPLKMTIEIERIEKDFENFWHWIEAEGDLDAALGTWEIVRNPSEVTRREILTAESRRQIYELKRLSRNLYETFKRVLKP